MGHPDRRILGRGAWKIELPERCYVAAEEERGLGIPDKDNMEIHRLIDIG